MLEFVDLYDIEIDNKIKIELLYINKNSYNNVEVVLEDENKKKYKFKEINKLYNKNNILEGFTCKIELDFDINKKYVIKIKEDNTYRNINWSNNQNKLLDFNNLFYIFKNNYKIILLNNGLSISKKKLFDKFVYNFNKVIYGIKKYKKIYIFRFLKFNNYYNLINDRVSDANDNGEALFKYISANDKYLSKKTYYVINRNSSKYKELKKLGKVLKFGSLKHKFIYLNSNLVATSYIGNGANVYNPFSEDEMEMYRDLINKKVVFLQHGIMMTDFHLMFNRARMAIDKFVVSTKCEYNNILKQGYLYEEDMLIKTGLPRHDLLKNDIKKNILFFTTWRLWLTNLSNEEFINSEYYNRIKSILTNKDFNDLLVQYNYKLDFVLHAELTKYYDLFKCFENSNIKIHKSSDISYSQLFSTCSMLITDYSSIHFDVAYLKKPIIYYQYDLDKFLSNHTNNGSGGFSYELDGYGNVIKEEKDLINYLDICLLNDCKMEDKYVDKVNDSFFNTDGTNSKKVCEVMKTLNEDKSKNYRFNNVQ